MDMLERLRTFGAYVMDEEGNLTDFQPNALTSYAAKEIDRLTIGLHFAAGLLSSMDPYSHMSPDQMLEFLLSESRNGSADRAEMVVQDD